MMITCPKATAIQLDRRTLLRVLERVGRVIPARSGKPILAGVHLEASDGRLRLRGTDLDVSMECTVPCAGSLPATVVACKDLHTRIKLGKASICTLRHDGERAALIVNGGRVEHVLPTLPVEEFPPCRMDPTGRTFMLSADELKLAIHTCLAAVAKETTRYALSSILLERDGTGARLVATDGRRLVECTLAQVDGLTQTDGGTEMDGEFHGQVLLPHRLSVLLDRLIEAQPETAIAFHVEIAHNEHGEPQPARIEVGTHDWRLATTEAEGRFPAYRDIIPQSGSRFVVHRKAFIELLSEVAQATDFERRAVRLDLSTDAVRVSAQSAGNGEASGSIPATFAGGGDDRVGDDRVIIAFAPKFLMDACKNLPGDRIVIDVQQNRICPTTHQVLSHPALLHPEEQVSPRWVIMPISLGLPPSRESLGSNHVEEAA